MRFEQGGAGVGRHGLGSIVEDGGGYSPLGYIFVQSIHCRWLRFGLCLAVWVKVSGFKGLVWQSLHFIRFRLVHECAPGLNEKPRLWPGLLFFFLFLL